MRIKNRLVPAVEYYKDLRLQNLTSQKYRHVLMALYWALYGAVFGILEAHLPRWLDISYQAVYCKWDDLIPFCEWFVIPYYYWFVFLIGFGAFWFFFEPEIFREWMWAIILSYSVTVVVYLAWPNMQTLRPMAFERDNLLTRIVQRLYDFDTNTNVCPSIHCLGSYATAFAGCHSQRLSGGWWKTSFIFTAVLISASTVFLKQHSIIDVLAAVGVGGICYAVQYGIFPKCMTAKGRRQAAVASSKEQTEETEVERV